MQTPATINKLTKFLQRTQNCKSSTLGIVRRSIKQSLRKRVARDVSDVEQEMRIEKAKVRRSLKTEKTLVNAYLMDKNAERKNRFYG